MNALDALLLLAVLTAALALICGRWLLCAPVLIVAYGAQGGALLALEPRAGAITTTLPGTVFSQPLWWRYDAAAWLMALIVLGAGLVNTWSIAAQAMPGRPAYRAQLAVALQVAALLTLLGAADLLTFAFGWCAWLAVSPLLAHGVAAWHAARRAIVSATLLLGGLGLAWASAGTLDVAALRTILPTLDASRLAALGLLWGAACALSIPGAAADAGIGTRWRVVSITVVCYLLTSWWLGALVPVRLQTLAALGINAQVLLIGLAAAIIVVATVLALRAHTPTSLLVWLGLAQLGYPVLGVVSGSASGTAGALLHLFTDTLAQTVLWLTLAAMAHSVRIPLTRALLIMAALSLSGVPPFAGFIPKWLIWNALAHWPLAQAILLLGLLGTVAATYRLWRMADRASSAVRTALPAAVLAPALGLAALLILIGIVPGGALRWVAAAQDALGWPPIRWHLGGVAGLIDMPRLALICGALAALSIGGWALSQRFFSKQAH